MDLHSGTRSPPSSSSHSPFPAPDPSVAIARHTHVLVHQLSLVSLVERHSREVHVAARTVYLSWIRSQEKCLRSLQRFRTKIARFSQNGCKSHISHKDRSETQLPLPVHRPLYRPSADTAPQTPLLGTLVRRRRTRVGNSLGPNARPYAPAQSPGTGAICRHLLNLQVPAQSTSTGSVCRHRLNLQARAQSTGPL